MRKGKFSIISSTGKVIVATVKFEDGEVWDICNEGYDLNQSHNKKSCWVEENQIYLDEHRERKLKQKHSSKTVKPQSHQQNQGSQQRNEMSSQDCIGKQTVLHKTRLPIDTREALADSDNAFFDNFSLKLNKAARFDCRVKIEKHNGHLCSPFLPNELSDIVRLEDGRGRDVGADGNPEYLSIHRPLTDHEKNRWWNSNPAPEANAESNEKKITWKKRNTIQKLFEQSQYKERKFRFCETNKEGFLYQPASFFGNLDLGEIAYRHRRSIEALNLSVSSCKGTIDWRLIVGLGNESVYDTSMTLHHVYGIPYIPASAVKGVVRSWIIIEKFDQIEEKAIQDRGFCDVFGCPKKIKDTPSYYGEERQGKVWFFDAFPLSEPRIEVDIMNPHYGDYYNLVDPEPPADYLKPNPITFLTVGEKDKDWNPLQFQFLTGIKERDNRAIKSLQDKTESMFEGEKPFKVATDFLKAALALHGIGAKTAVGYGYMKDFQTGDGS